MSPQSDPRSAHAKCRTGGRRKGAVAVLSAVLMVPVLAMVCFSVDLGYILAVKTELQRSADSAALAGVGVLVDGEDEAAAMAREYAAMNLVGGIPVAAEDVVIESGQWDAENRVFTPTVHSPTGIRVTLRRDRQALFFGPVLGKDSFDLTASAIAVFRPRDIMLVLDYSGSMNDDSELRNIGSIGRAAVESNLWQIYNELGAPTFGNMQWNPVYISTTENWRVKRILGLSDVPYPYPSGSWDDYISYVESSGYIRDAGYRQRYGYLTWVNYLLERKPMFSQTPDLWRTSEQPITAVKNAVTLFLAFLQEVDTNDRLGLAVYTSASGDAVLESELTHNMPYVEEISRERQAGHYDVYTNIGAGLRVAREELEGNGRSGALRLIVLMTDGIANRPYNTSAAKAYALEQAEAAADAKIPVVTVSLGAGADMDLMEQIAAITGGVHFNVPGGQPVAEYEEDLKDVFRKVADSRPLRLAQ